MNLSTKTLMLLAGIKSDFVFNSRPLPLPADLRVNWKLPLLLLSLQVCGRAGKMTLKKAHVINWAARGNQSRSSLRRMLSGEIGPEDVLVRFDPSFNRAIDLAVGDGLVSIHRKTTGSIISLTHAGTVTATWLISKTVFEEEKQFFNEVGKISEESISRLLNWED